MGLFRNREKRLEAKAKRRNRRAGRKETRAARAAANGNNKRAERLRKRADKLRRKADRNLFWDHCVIEQMAYTATADELVMIKDALTIARRKSELIETHLSELEGLSRSDAETLWNEGPIGEYFGDDPNNRQRRKFMRRVRKITNTLLGQLIYIKLKNSGGQWYGRTAPSVLNRPLSKNVRFRLDPPLHNLDVTECTDTIVHEIAHTLNVVTNEPGDETLRKAMRDPDTYAKFFVNFPE